LSAD